MADGVLAKLIILPFEDSENVQLGPPSGPPFIAQFNPEGFTINNEFEYETQEGHGGDGGEAKFKGVKPRTFSFEMLLDGTGANGETPRREVLLQVELFKRTVGFSGKIHRPPFLVLNWGSLIVTCVLENFSVNYKLFRPNGTPLRATLSATFKEHKPKAVSELLKNLSSPDVVHSHVVKENEHLSLIAYRVYKDPRYYFQVGEENRLHNLRHVDPGTTLNLPPLS